MNKSILLLSISFLIFFNSCEEKGETPTNPNTVRVDSVTVYNYPMDEGGLEWDNNLTGDSINPDPYFTISFGTQLVFESDYIDDADGEPITFSDFESVIELSPTNLYTFSLYDYDSLAIDPLMSELSFDPYLEQYGIISSLFINDPTMPIQMDLSYTY